MGHKDTLVFITVIICGLLLFGLLFTDVIVHFNYNPQHSALWAPLGPWLFHLQSSFSPGDEKGKRIDGGMYTPSGWCLSALLFILIRFPSLINALIYKQHSPTRQNAAPKRTRWNCRIAQLNPDKLQPESSGCHCPIHRISHFLSQRAFKEF